MRWNCANYSRFTVFSQRQSLFSRSAIDAALLSQGIRIQASIRRTLIYKFEKTLAEGSVYSIHFFGFADNSGDFRTTSHSYKITFQYATKVIKLDDDVGVYPSLYSFVPISQIYGGGLDIELLVDVIGLLNTYGTERVNERNGLKTKMNTITLEADGYKIDCTLFGPYVDQLNDFLATGDKENVVVLIQYAKVRLFQGNFNLQNALFCTRLIFNPDCPEAHDLRKRRILSSESPSQVLTQVSDSTKVTVEEDFLTLTPKKTIEGLKEFKENMQNVQNCSFVVAATVKHIMHDWWYLACNCSKGVIPDEKLYYCSKCNKYRILVRVMDQTDSTTFVIFDREASLLMNKSCVQLIESSEKNDSTALPNELSDLVEKTYLFKVDICKDDLNPRFELSFTVKKICTDPSIVAQFKDLAVKNLDSKTSSSCSVGKKVLSSSDVVGQDLMTKFCDAAVDLDGVGDCDAAVDTESQCYEKEGINLSNDSEDLTPKKRVCPSQRSSEDVQMPMKILKKNIKIEKD